MPTEPVVPSYSEVAHEIGGPSPIPSPKSPPNYFDVYPEASGGPVGHSTLQVPKSPRTPRSMGHVIRHRFTKTFKPARCDLCTEYMFNGKNIWLSLAKLVYVFSLKAICFLPFLTFKQKFKSRFSGLKCKECKFKCHRDCEPQVPPSCGLPEDLVKYYMNHMYKEGSPILPARLNLFLTTSKYFQ